MKDYLVLLQKALHLELCRYKLKEECTHNGEQNKRAKVTIPLSACLSIHPPCSLYSYIEYTGIIGGGGVQRR